MSPITRRDFLSGAGGAALAAAAWPVAVQAGMIDLHVSTRQIAVKGKAATVFGITDSAGRHGSTGILGEDFAVRLHNGLDEPTLVHWHGLTPPWRQDGVPGLTQDPLAPGGSYDYRFTHTRSGTHWMHSHLGLQEQRLLAAPLIVHEPGAATADEQEVMVMLHDFSFTPPEEILARLKGGSEAQMMTGAAGHGAMHGTGGHAAGASGGHAAGHGAQTGGSGGHAAPAGAHYNDIDHDAYLANDRNLDDPQVVAVERGGIVRLRIINAATTTGFYIDLGALTGELIAVDGNAVEPVRGTRFPLAIAQRADIRLAIPAEGGAFPILALREAAAERTGLVLSTKGATVHHIAGTGEAADPLTLDLERKLKALAPLPTRQPDRSIRVDLTGSHDGYVWGIAVDGAPGARLSVRRGERVELVLRNQTMMPHPMHLHGHHFQVTRIGHDHLSGAWRDTVLVPPQAEVAVAFDADNPGLWAFHCHQLYHMAEGMMATLAYEDLA